MWYIIDCASIDFCLKLATMGPKLNEDYGDTVPSKPQVQVTNEVHATSTLKKQHTLEDMEEGIAYFVYLIFLV